MAPHGVGADADLAHGIAQLLLGDAEVLRPIAQLPGFVDIDAAAIGRAAVIQIINHRFHSLSAVLAGDNQGAFGRGRWRQRALEASCR